MVLKNRKLTTIICVFLRKTPTKNILLWSHYAIFEPSAGRWLLSFLACLPNFLFISLHFQEDILHVLFLREIVKEEIINKTGPAQVFAPLKAQHSIVFYICKWKNCWNSSWLSWLNRKQLLSSEYCSGTRFDFRFKNPYGTLKTQNSLVFCICKSLICWTIYLVYSGEEHLKRYPKNSKITFTLPRELQKTHNFRNFSKILLFGKDS